MKEKIEDLKNYHPVKIADNIWQFFVHDYDNVLIFVIDKLPTMEDLLKLNISKESAEYYINHDNYGDGDGRCMNLIDDCRKIIIVSIYQLETETFYSNIATAVHELNHCSHRIISSKGKREYIKYEETHCTMQDWLVEAYLCIHLNNANFERLYINRDLLWFKIVTNK